MDVLGLGGIILIRKQDPITKLYLKIGRVNFSDIGFYYKKTYNKGFSYQAIIIDIFGIPEINIKEVDLNDYLKREPLGEIKYKKIKPICDINHFIFCIKEVLKQKTINSKKDLMINFIRGTFFSFEIFNRTIQKINGSTPGAEISSKYLLDSKYLELETEYKISPKDNLTDTIKQNFISNMRTLTDLILGNSEFYGEIIKNLSDRGSEAYMELDIIIKNYFDSSQSFYEGIVKGLKYGKMKSEDFIRNYQLFQHDLNKVKGSNESVNLIDDNNKNSILLFHDTKARITASNNIKSMLTVISNDIKTNKIPIIRLNKLIHNFNILMEKIDKDYRPVKVYDEDTSTYGLITTNDNVSVDIPVQLKNGTKLMIPMNETNYSRFTKEQLEEMLIILDIYSNGNIKFDQIRSRITRELATKINKE